LSRERVLRAAVKVADRDGLESLSMRRVAKACGVEAMSLYNHVASKDDLLDGMVDLVFGEIEVPAGVEWRTAMRRRAISARETLLRHRWAIGVMESRMRAGPVDMPESMRVHNAVMGCLRESGFSFEMAVHAYSVQDAYIYGFLLQERSLPFDTAEESGAVAAAQAPSFEDFPYLMEVATELPKRGYDYATEFEFGLDLILDGLERVRSGG
jgi:AcrR family transcriptional regulator